MRIVLLLSLFVVVVSVSAAEEKRVLTKDITDNRKVQLVAVQISIRRGSYKLLVVRNGSELTSVTKETIARQLKAKGLKLTPQRLAIIEVLIAKRNFHPGARSVYEEAKKRKKSLSLSTTYATLNELSRLGIIKTLQFDSVENRYEGNLEEHLNLVCEGCGKILDYEVPPVADPQEIAKKTGFSVTDTRLEYYGYCKECRARNKRGRG